MGKVKLEKAERARVEARKRVQSRKVAGVKAGVSTGDSLGASLKSTSQLDATAKSMIGVHNAKERECREKERLLQSQLREQGDLLWDKQQQNVLASKNQQLEQKKQTVAELNEQKRLERIRRREEEQAKFKAGEEARKAAARRVKENEKKMEKRREMEREKRRHEEEAAAAALVAPAAIPAAARVKVQKKEQGADPEKHVDARLMALKRLREKKKKDADEQAGNNAASGVTTSTTAPLPTAAKVAVATAEAAAKEVEQCAQALAQARVRKMRKMKKLAEKKKKQQQKEEKDAANKGEGKGKTKTKSKGTIIKSRTADKISLAATRTQSATRRSCKPSPYDVSPYAVTTTSRSSSTQPKSTRQLKEARDADLCYSDDSGSDAEVGMEEEEEEDSGEASLVLEMLTQRLATIKEEREQAGSDSDATPSKSPFGNTFLHKKAIVEEEQDLQASMEAQRLDRAQKEFEAKLEFLKAVKENQAFKQEVHRAEKAFQEEVNVDRIHGQPPMPAIKTNSCAVVSAQPASDFKGGEICIAKAPLQAQQQALGGITSSVETRLSSKGSGLSKLLAAKRTRAERAAAASVATCVTAASGSPM